MYFKDNNFHLCEVKRRQGAEQLQQRRPYCFHKVVINSRGADFWFKSGFSRNFLVSNIFSSSCRSLSSFGSCEVKGFHGERAVQTTLISILPQRREPWLRMGVQKSSVLFHIQTDRQVISDPGRTNWLVSPTQVNQEGEGEGGPETEGQTDGGQNSERDKKGEEGRDRDERVEENIADISGRLYIN